MEERWGLRITTWNVNGIRNPFGYQPWRQQRTFAAMFDILQADIVVMQETKIQRKDLQDDMVLVPGWDVFFSLPKHKKGYSGVAIYTRMSVCAPIRAEEGITGILTSPNSSTSYCDLAEDQKIGGYPTPTQLSDFSLDNATLDSEGRCVVLEFPAFVLIGVYSPATRDATRDEFRLGFQRAMESRVRNLVSAGKRVVLAGDLNIIRTEIDTANLEEDLRKQEMTVEEYLSTPARRMLNQLVVGGRIFGERDEGTEKPVMWDICRSFHPDRKGMFTHWEQKINARPGNYGSRIDYLLCSESCKDWFCESDIQEGLMGSDHCPVYVVLKEKVDIEGAEVDIKDMMSGGMFKAGKRYRDWSTRDLLPMSARLIPEFDRRRSIRDMFATKPTSEAMETISSGMDTAARGEEENSLQAGTSLHEKMALPNKMQLVENQGTDIPIAATNSQESVTAGRSNSKRPSENPQYTTRPPKQSKPGAASKSTTVLSKGQAGKGQSSLMGFFKPKAPISNAQTDNQTLSKSEIESATIELSNESLSTQSAGPHSNSHQPHLSPSSSLHEKKKDELKQSGNDESNADPTAHITQTSESHQDSVSETSNAETSPSRTFNPADQESVVDPIVAKESWSRLLGKRVVPRCEHNEPCISLTTKKPGVNCGRAFYMCPRPLGPSGRKERNTSWRCGTFVWSSDWTGDANPSSGIRNFKADQ